MSPRCNRMLGGVGLWLASPRPARVLGSAVAEGTGLRSLTYGALLGLRRGGASVALNLWRFVCSCCIANSIHLVDESLPESSKAKKSALAPVRCEEANHSVDIFDVIVVEKPLRC